MATILCATPYSCRFHLFLYVIVLSLNPIPLLWPLPYSLPTGNNCFFLYESVSIFCILLFHFLVHISNVLNNCVSLSDFHALWSIHIAANDNFHSFYDWIIFHVYVYAMCVYHIFFIHLSVLSLENQFIGNPYFLQKIYHKDKDRFKSKWLYDYNMQKVTTKRHGIPN